MGRRPKLLPDSNDDTRQRLILAAGELFAEKGFGDTSVRDIARMAGANVAAVNYHFTSKENLYLEVVRFVLGQMTAVRRTAMADIVPAALTQPQAVEALRVLIDREIRSYVSSDLPRWYARLILRCIMSKSPVLDPIMEQAFRPNRQALMSLLKAACPHLSDEETRLWAYSITGQIVFYNFAREPILLLAREKEYTEKFLRSVVAHITRVTFSGLGLDKHPVRRPKKQAGKKS
ncbi:MAG TPA: CerR family C-terminal domain-containing protein [Candidatus Hydrogenedentes bacterium]|nr:CerR family C-terminal domain-containing protein [Candidatus Hydrogenedentota bacterium]